MRLLPSLRGLPRGYWFLWTGALVNRLGSFVMPFLTLYLTGQRGYSLERAGAIVSLFGVGNTLAAPTGGWLADRVGRRPTLLFALTAGALSIVHLGLARAPAHIAVAALMAGFFNEMYRPAMQASIADQVAPEDRTRAYGFLYWAVNLGWAVASTVAGVLAHVGYLWLFLGDAATTLGFAAIAWRFIPETRPPRAATIATSPRPRFAALAPLRDGVFVAFFILSFFTALMFQQCWSGLPLDMRAHGVNERSYGLLMALNGVLIVLLQPFAVAAVERVPRRSVVLALGVLLVGGGFGLCAIGGSVPLYLVSIVVWTFGEILTAPVTPSVVADLAPPHQRGLYQGAFTMSFGLSSMIAPTVGTFLLGHFGGRALWVACAITGVVVAIGHLVIAPWRRRRLGGARPGFVPSLEH